MMRRIVSLFLALMVPCWMEAAMGPVSVCPGAHENSKEVKNATAESAHHTTSSSQTGHECCPPVAKKQNDCEHATAGTPQCSMKSSNCCFAKAPEGQVPPSKTASGTVAHELIAASTFWTALNAHLANVPAGGDPPAIPAVQFGVVLRI